METGIRKEKINLQEIANILLSNILEDMKLEKDDEVAVMVNGLVVLHLWNCIQ